MADQKISQLADAGTPQDTDQLVLARAGTTLSLLFSSLKAAIPGGVTSVFGRTGAVTAQTGDYTASQVGALPSTDDLSAIATANPTAAAIAMNSKKITGLANGTASSDAAAFGQIPTALPPNGSAGGDLSGTYPNPSVKAVTETGGPTDLTLGSIPDGNFLKRSGSTIVGATAGGSGTVTSVTAADTSIVIAGTATDPTVKTATLDVIATDHPAAADWSNNSKKITSVKDPTAAQDAATKNYVDSVTPGNGGGKGHLTTATAANTPSDLAPGADGTVLTADSTQSNGLTYTTPGMVLLGSQSLSSAGSTLTVGSIPASYTTLYVLLSVKSASASLLDTAVVHFNSDTTAANYASQTLDAHSTSVSAAATTGVGGLSIQICGATHNYFSPVTMTVPRYALTSTDADKMVTWQSVTLVTGPAITSVQGCGTWGTSGSASAAITAITAVTGSGSNFVAQSYMSVYGMY